MKNEEVPGRLPAVSSPQSGVRGSNILPWLAGIGEVLLLVGAALWLPQHHWGGLCLCVGTVLFAAGRLLGRQGDWAQSANPDIPLTARRLFRQRMLGLVFLVLAAVAICHRGGFVGTLYLRPASWLVPFCLFVAIELYTAFRLPRVMNQD